MAIIRDGYLGGFQGRMGPTVGYQWRGKWVVRTFSSHPRNPRTAAQQEHRMLFKQQVQLAGRLNWVLRETLDLVSMEHGMTPCNYFVMRNQEAFGTITTPSPLRGTPPQEGETGKAEQTPQSLRDSSPSLGEQQTTLAVDWERLVLSEGPVAPVAFGAPEVADGTTLVVPFERNPLHVRADNYDRVYIYVYCPEIERGFFSAPVYRREQRLAVVLPESFAGREVQVWGMVQDAAGRWSQTLYIGHGPIENTETETHPSVSVKNGATSPLSGSNGDMACDRSGANLGEELNGRGRALGEKQNRNNINKISYETDDSNDGSTAARHGDVGAAGGDRLGVAEGCEDGAADAQRRGAGGSGADPGER